MISPEEDSKLMVPAASEERKKLAKKTISGWGYDYKMGYGEDVTPGKGDTSFDDALTMKERTLAWNTGISRAMREKKNAPAPKTDTTNPKDAFGSAKVPTSTIPSGVMLELGLAMFEGALKYGRHNYRATPVRASVYYDAFQRHVKAWWEGETIDPTCDLPHLIKAMACLTIIRDCEMVGTLVDDRPPAMPEGWMDELNDKAKALVEKYPDPAPANTET